MLKMVSKKSMLLLGAVLALCAFVLPSVASAASWTPVGTTDGRIHSNNLGFSIMATTSGAFCTSTAFSVTVDSALVATITGASFENCHGDRGTSVGCTMTMAGTNFPWRMTAVATNNIQIHGIDIDISIEQTPGTLGECVLQNTNLRVTGTATASFTPGPAGDRTIDFTGGPAGALVVHIPGLGTAIAALTGRATATGLLNVLD
jgi:hypothetical protein